MFIIHSFIRMLNNVEINLPSSKYFRFMFGGRGMLLCFVWTMSWVAYNTTKKFQQVMSWHLLSNVVALCINLVCRKSRKRSHRERASPPVDVDTRREQPETAGPENYDGVNVFPTMNQEYITPTTGVCETSQYTSIVTDGDVISPYATTTTQNEKHLQPVKNSARPSYRNPPVDYL